MVEFTKTQNGDIKAHTPSLKYAGYGLNATDALHDLLYRNNTNLTELSRSERRKAKALTTLFHAARPHTRTRGRITRKDAVIVVPLTDDGLIDYSRLPKTEQLFINL